MNLNSTLNDFDAITYNLPSSNSVDTRIFGRLLEDSRVVASYKMYWLLGILEEQGTLSIDHFIPWSFVMHDEMWNLVPTFKNINSKKKR